MKVSTSRRRDIDVATPDGQRILGKHGYDFEPNIKISEADANDYDLLVLPGGKVPEKVRVLPESVEIAMSRLVALKQAV